MDLVSFGGCENYMQNPITPLQPVQQPIPNWVGVQNDYIAKMEGNYQYNVALNRSKAEIDMIKYQKKRQIDEAHAMRMMEAKADIQIKKGMLSDTVRLTEEGVLIRRQEYLMERPIEYSFANFRLNGCPIRYVTGDGSSGVLCLRVILQSQEERVLYLDLEKDRAEYYRKKFHRAGIVLEKKRSDKKEMIFEIVQVLDQVAGIVTLPSKRGFYRTEDQSLHYAGREDLLWKEVKKYAL